jgi:hypothetical protein
MSYDIFPVNGCGTVGLVSREDKRPYEVPPNGWNVVINGEMHNGAVRVASASGPIPGIDVGSAPVIQPSALAWV